MAKMTGFVFQDSYLKRLERLTDAELGKLVRALSVYHAQGTEEALEGRALGAFDFIKADIDDIDKRYTEKCESNRRNRSSTNDNERQQSSTNDNERQQSSTNADKEKIKEKEKEKDIDDDDTARACEETDFGTVTIDPVIVELQKNIGALASSHYDDLAAFREVLPDELVMEAISEAVAHGARTWAYVRTVLQGYIKDGVRTVGAARERAEKRKREGPPGKSVTAQQYAQRQYSETELEGRCEDL